MKTVISYHVTDLSDSMCLKQRKLTTPTKTKHKVLRGPGARTKGYVYETCLCMFYYIKNNIFLLHSIFKTHGLRMHFLKHFKCNFKKPFICIYTSKNYN